METPGAPQGAIYLTRIDSRIMSLRIKDFATGLDLINEAIRLYRPVELNEEWKEHLPEETVTRRVVHLFSTPEHIRFKEYLMVNAGKVELTTKTLAELRDKFITYHVLIHGSQAGTRSQRTQQEVSYYAGTP